MNCVNLLKLTITATSIAIGTVGSTTTASAAYNLCEINTVPEAVIKKTIKHPDFGEILERMLIACPEAALSLTEAATAAVAGGTYEGPDGGGEGSGGSSGGGSGGTS